jgi:hypothetical protein
MSGAEPSIRDLLTAQTGKLVWAELARHFARGVVLRVDESLDLVEVAEKLVRDNSGSIENLYKEGLFRRASDDDAIRWQQDDPVFWAVVVAPWVLVQEIVNQG